MSDKNQKVSDCIVTKLSFSKEMFDGQITLPEGLSFNSTEKNLKKAGFKKDADGVYCYTSKRIKDDTIKMPMTDGESVSEITLERAVDENAATATTASNSATTEVNSSAATSAKNDNKGTTAKTATTESSGTTEGTQKETDVEDFSQETPNAASEEQDRKNSVATGGFTHLSITEINNYAKNIDEYCKKYYSIQKLPQKFHKNAKEYK